MYGYKTWSTTKGDEEKMACLEKRVYKRIYGLIIKNKEYRITKREIQLVYQKPGINAYQMSKRNE